MANITQKGRLLAAKVASYTEDESNWWQQERLCSLIARHATSLHHIYEAECNGHPANGDPRIPAERAAKLQERHDAWCEKRARQLEARIEKLAESLPGISGVYFQGDPRGRPVHLITENGQGDSWSHPGAIVV